MIDKDKLVELMQEYLQAAKELHDYTTPEGMDTPCGFFANDPIHMYCTPGTYGSLSKLFDSGSYHTRPTTVAGGPTTSSQLSEGFPSRFSGLLMNIRRCTNNGCYEVSRGA